MLLYYSFDRGHNHKLFVPFCRSNIRKNYFVFRKLRIRNELPKVIVCSNVFTAFKRRINENDLSN